MEFWGKLTRFEGRLRRRDYWLLSILIFAVSWGVAIAIYLVGVGDGMDEESADLLSRVASLAVGLWPSLAVGVKRCHDRGQGGAMVLIQIIPVVGLIWAFVNLGILEGTLGPNQYGPSPKGIGREADKQTVEVFS